MGRAGTRGKLLEAFKFAVYLSIPVGVTLVSIQPENLEWIIRNRQYVVYPKENKRPPTVRASPRACVPNCAHVTCEDDGMPCIFEHHRMRRT